MHSSINEILTGLPTSDQALIADKNIRKIFLINATSLKTSQKGYGINPPKLYFLFRSNGLGSKKQINVKRGRLYDSLMSKVLNFLTAVTVFRQYAVSILALLRCRTIILVNNTLNMNRISQ